MAFIYDASEASVKIKGVGDGTTTINNFSDDGVDISTNIEHSRIPNLVGTSGFNVSGDDSAEITVNVMSTSPAFNELMDLWQNHFAIGKLSKESVCEVEVNVQGTGMNGVSSITLGDAIMSSAPEVPVDSNEASSVEFTFIGYNLSYNEE